MIAGEVQRIAEAYPPSAAQADAGERERFMTPLQQLAWFVRFRPTDPAADALSAIVVAQAQVNLTAPASRSNLPHHEAHHGRS